MKNLISITIILMLSAIFFSSFTNANSVYNIGSVSSADASCNLQSNFYEGEQVNVFFSKLSSGSHTWSIKNLCNNQTLASGSFFAEYSPYNYCINATFAESACEYYEVKVTDYIYSNPSSTYSVTITPIVPEFGILIGSLTIFGALIAFFLIRKN